MIEIFRAEDMDKILDVGYQSWEAAKCVNQILNERLKVGYTNETENDEVVLSSIAVENFRDCTHTIYYITQPLEPEKVVCEHKLALSYNKTVKITNVVSSGPDNYLFEFCPKCGKELT